MALCLASDGVWDRPLSLELTPSQVASESASCCLEVALGEALLVRSASLDACPLSCSSCPLSGRMKLGAFFWPTFSHLSLNLLTDLISPHHAQNTRHLGLIEILKSTQRSRQVTMLRSSFILKVIMDSRFKSPLHLSPEWLAAPTHVVSGRLRKICSRFQCTLRPDSCHPSLKSDMPAKVPYNDPLSTAPLASSEHNVTNAKWEPQEAFPSSCRRLTWQMHRWPDGCELANTAAKGANESGRGICAGVGPSRRTPGVPRDHVALVTTAIEKFHTGLGGALGRSFRPIWDGSGPNRACTSGSSRGLSENGPGLRILRRGGWRLEGRPDF